MPTRNIQLNPEDQNQYVIYFANTKIQQIYDEWDSEFSILKTRKQKLVSKACQDNDEEQAKRILDDLKHTF